MRKLKSKNNPKYTMLKPLLLFLFCSHFIIYSQEGAKKEREYEKALVNYDDYIALVHKVKDIRAKNLISFDDLLEMQKEPNTVVLDTRSADKYAGKHVKGAINLPFTDFATENLRAIIPDTNTRIIIYCNNNFKSDQVFFIGKTYKTGKKIVNRKLGFEQDVSSFFSISLALNVPTYIHLYGYGYRNIYELDELVDIDDSRLQLGGMSK